ncbi:membrane protein insertase YidC [Halopseudomonas salegens]|uniref:Membrane protein insertase YidC n=1 Tax=Halopseudomonas salegens TaxID=1434072 RepID=A0A1H2HNU9_9GAMM|nr:membrane protein insertase YidC [Halopseudomonas salegens]SDU33409.1 protein translocase subunit yidC [Halopseudomonas salegens]
MNMQRNILIAALLVITYMMVLQWNRDYGQPDLSETVADTQQQIETADLPAMGVTEDNQTGGTDDANGDVPVAIEPTEEGMPATAPNEPVATSSNLIQVETDTFRLSIDPRGGDIVSIALPQYPRHRDRPDLPFQLLEQSNNHLYVAQSGLTGRNGPDARESGRPLYSADESEFTLRDGEDNLQIDLTFSENDITYIKRFTFNRGDYLIRVEYLIDNQSSETWSGNLFGQIKRDDSADPSSSGTTGMATYLGAAYWDADSSYTKISMGDMDDKNLRETVSGGWVAWLQHYFVSAWIPNNEQRHVYQTRKDRNGNYIAGFTSPTAQVAAGDQGVIQADFYAGPKTQDRLKEISPGLHLTVDYGFLWWIAQPLFFVLSFIHGFVGNWGWSIILLTMLIKLIFFPLSATSYRSMANMRRVSPKLQALREQFGDDRQKMSQAMMELYKKEKINPLGGCLPILVQMPVFIALYWVLMESVEMRQAEWIGWITDLSLKDPYFILPILMGASMFIQQLLNPTPPDPMQAKIMRMLPIIFTFFFLWFPSGLVLYWVVNNVLSIAQQWYITRQIEKGAKA